jgi:pimeloyl-ACP methyl ester carboxylesterase
MSTTPAASSGAGTPLVLLHAFPLDGRMWAPQVEALAGTYQVIVPDLRGWPATCSGCWTTAALTGSCSAGCLSGAT